MRGPAADAFAGERNLHEFVGEMAELERVYKRLKADYEASGGNG